MNWKIMNKQQATDTTSTVNHHSSLPQGHGTKSQKVKCSLSTLHKTEWQKPRAPAPSAISISQVTSISVGHRCAAIPFFVLSRLSLLPLSFHLRLTSALRNWNEPLATATATRTRNEPLATATSLLATPRGPTSWSNKEVPTKKWPGSMPKMKMRLRLRWSLLKKLKNEHPSMECLSLPWLSTRQHWGRLRAECSGWRVWGPQVNKGKTFHWCFLRCCPEQSLQSLQSTVSYQSQKHETSWSWNWNEMNRKSRKSKLMLLLNHKDRIPKTHEFTLGGLFVEQYLCAFMPKSANDGPNEPGRCGRH